jgi:hypothetical protein
LQWLNIGGLISIVWTAWQIYFLLFRPDGFPMWLWDIHDLFVVGTPYSLLKGGSRISGLAYEPSWFAYQLNLLYFPYWLAATFTKYSAFRGRILRLSFENIMLGIGIIEFYYSSPRIGMLAFLMMLIFICQME